MAMMEIGSLEERLDPQSGLLNIRCSFREGRKSY